MRGERCPVVAVGVVLGIVTGTAIDVQAMNNVPDDNFVQMTAHR